MHEPLVLSGPVEGRRAAAEGCAPCLPIWPLLEVRRLRGWASKGVLAKRSSRFVSVVCTLQDSLTGGESRGHGGQGQDREGARVGAVPRGIECQCARMVLSAPSGNPPCHSPGRSPAEGMFHCQTHHTLCPPAPAAHCAPPLWSTQCLSPLPPLSLRPSLPPPGGWTWGSGALCWTPSSTRPASTTAL